jgi:hypothetical protein
MGDIYIRREANNDRFTVGATRSLDQRMGGYERHNPNLRTYRVLRHPNHFALEDFLHKELANKLDRSIRSKSWYNVTAPEMDIAIERAETLGVEHLARKSQVDQIKNLATNGEWLKPNDPLREIHVRLAKVTLEMDALRQEEEMLKCEAMALIGLAEGVDGLFEWRSFEQRRFQQKAFAREHPDLFEAFKDDSFVRRFKLCNSQNE